MIRGKKTQTNGRQSARGAEECRKNRWCSLVVLFSGRGFSQSGTSDAASRPMSWPEWHQPKQQSSLSLWLMHHSNYTACPGPGQVVPTGQGAAWLRTDKQGVPREPPSSCPSPCHGCSVFLAKKPRDQVRLRRLQQKRVSTHTSLPTNSQNYTNKQIDSITRIGTSPIQGDWYIHYRKMQPDHIYMKKSLYANLWSGGEGSTV